MQSTQTVLKRRRGMRGFTLVELMVVIVIIGLLAGLVGVNLLGQADKARRTTAKAQIETFDQAAKAYRIDTGQYPLDLLDLVSQPPNVNNWNRNGYLDESVIPLDPWGGEYYYQEPGIYSAYDIYSLGPDGMEGGEDEDADVYNVDIGVSNEVATDGY